MGTEVNVDDVGLSIWDGQGTIDGLMIQHPDPFSDRSAVAFKTISLQVDLSTLLSDMVVVINLGVQNLKIFVEQTAERNNLRTLQHQLGRSSSSSGVHLFIDHLLINPDYSPRNLIVSEAKFKSQMKRPEGFRDVECTIFTSTLHTIKFRSRFSQYPNLSYRLFSICEL